MATYGSLMVHLAVGQSNAAVLRVVADLAELYRARVIGIAASQPSMPWIGSSYVARK
jgi:hypothetical protein